MLSYDPTTGIFTRNKSTKGAKKGSVAGSIRKADGYVMVRLDGYHLLGHVLAWFYVHGEWPKTELDHEDRCRSNNRIGNLRPTTRSLNCFNVKVRKNRSGFKGVSPYKGKFVAAIRVDGKKTVLGTFENPQDAAAAYDVAALSMVGSTATTNHSLGLIS